MTPKLISFIALGFFLLAASLAMHSRIGEPHIRIMPLGDSITQGASNAVSYRQPLWKMLKKTNARLDFVGSMRKNYLQVGPTHSGFDSDHEGHWGWRTDEVLAKIDGWTEQAEPDIVLLHLGTNDIFQKQKIENTVEELRQIISILRKDNPRVEVLLAQLIPVRDRNANMKVQKLNSLLPDMAQSITTNDSPVHIVNQYEGFDVLKDTYDGIHPNEFGIVKMAQKWYDVLAVRLRIHK